MDFMLYAMDAIVNQAAKWSHMTGGQAHPSVTFRSIINRGGEQGAQHSQSLHSWFAHVPGLRVVMPSTVKDARDLLIASVLCKDPVMFIDDRWLYDLTDGLPPVIELDLKIEGPKCLRSGSDITIVGSGYATRQALDAASILQNQGFLAEVIDLRVLNPFDPQLIIDSVKKTGRLLVVDGGWKTAGFSAEVIAAVFEKLEPGCFLKPPIRITLPCAPAPCSPELEQNYYTRCEEIVASAVLLMS
jgi:pyruvate dehydrogenase E1 component beta subunit